jgi:hypothetical protein
MGRWINSRQQQRDHAGLRDVCAACGDIGGAVDPLDLDDHGFRVHARHLVDLRSGLQAQTPRKKNRGEA